MNYDCYGEIDLPEVFCIRLKKKERQIRVHDFGYVESDTNATVSGAEDELPYWQYAEGDFTDEVTQRELLEFIENDTEIRAVYLSNDLGRIGSRYIHRKKEPFLYDGKQWRVYQIRARQRLDVKGYEGRLIGRIDEDDNYRCFAILVTFGHQTLEEFIESEQDKNDFQWHDCSCQDHDEDWGWD